MQAGFNERYFGEGFASDKQGRLRQPYRAVCGKCGARRVDAQLGLEDSPDAYVAALVAVFREVRRVLRNDGCLWLNVGDCFANERSWGGKSGVKNATSDAGGYPRHKVGPGLGNKQLLMMPSRVAIALQEDGWLLRSMIPYLKRSAMPESVSDRPTTATEYVFLLAKSERYFYDSDAVRAPHTDRNVVDGVYQNRRAVNRPEWEPREKDGLARESFRMKDRDYNPAGRNRRNADWWFDSLRAILDGAGGLLADEDGAPLALPVNPQPFPGSHFAVFPERLVEPMLLASTSARGCCPACGAPYTRETEMVDGPADAFRNSGRYVSQGVAVSNTAHDGGTPRGKVRGATTGWRAGCACADAGDPIPCTVLDPFCGSGTVSLVARKHGRTSWGVDLSAAYLDLARERLGQLALPGLAAGG